MVVVDRSLEREVADVDVAVLSEEEVFQWGIVLAAVQVAGPELVVVTDQTVHRVPHDQHQPSPVVRQPEPLSHPGSVEIAGSFLHRDLPR